VCVCVILHSIELAPVLLKTKTVAWSILNVTYQKAEHDLASVHFRPTIKRTDILVVLNAALSVYFTLLEFVNDTL